MNLKGNNWCILGMMDTGKTYTACQIAKYFRERPESPKRTIVFLHTENNISYPDNEFKTIHINDLDYVLPKRGAFKIRLERRHYLEQITEKCGRIMNACIILDDLTGITKGNISEDFDAFLYTAKNNRLEIIFQLHTIQATAPALFNACGMIILKNTLDPLIIKNSINLDKPLGRVLAEIKKENQQYPEKRKWASRMFDVTAEKVLTQKLDGSPFPECFINPVSIEKYV